MPIRRRPPLDDPVEAAAREADVVESGCLKPELLANQVVVEVVMALLWCISPTRSALAGLLTATTSGEAGRRGIR